MQIRTHNRTIFIRDARMRANTVDAKSLYFIGIFSIFATRIAQRIACLLDTNSSCVFVSSR